MDDVNQVAATLAAAIYSSDRAAQPPALGGVMRGNQAQRVAELFWEVRQKLIETQPRGR